MVRGARARSLSAARLDATLPALPSPRGTRLESCGCAALGVRGGGVLPLYYLLRPLPPLFPTAAKHHSKAERPLFPDIGNSREEKLSQY